MKVFFAILLLTCSNCFMTLAWYGHLRKGGYGSTLTLPLIILVSWGIAFFEYCLMVPANRLGASGGLSAGQLKVIQEVITLSVFIPFSLLYLGEKWRWDYLWAFLCIVGAVFFVNRQQLLARFSAPAVATVVPAAK